MKKFIGFDFLNFILVSPGVFGKDIFFLTRINAQFIFEQLIIPLKMISAFSKSGTIEKFLRYKNSGR
jgi:hypothetical protein